MTSELDDNICIRCGMCCDGTLFQYANIDDDETLTTQYSFDVGTNSAGEKRFFLPCGYLQNKCCSIYQSRPYKVCDHYKCTTLRHYEKGEVSRNDALMVIEQVLAVKADIQSKLETEFSFVLGKTFNEKVINLEKYYAALPDQKDFEMNNRNLLLNIVKFKLLKDRFFYKNKQTESAI